ncbi:hypothetical protein MD484_g3511, partial [Candolleomyces efflorescens]
MIFAKVVVALTTALLVSAQDTAGISPCILACSTAGVAANNCSSITDFACICSSSQFQADTAKCITDNCPESLEAAINLQLAQCGAASISPTGTAGPPRTLTVTIPSTSATGSATTSGAPAATTSSGASIAGVAWGAAGFAAAAFGLTL